jgi:hypothetical protein
VTMTRPMLPNSPLGEVVFDPKSVFRPGFACYLGDSTYGHR